MQTPIFRTEEPLWFLETAWCSQTQMELSESTVWDLQSLMGARQMWTLGDAGIGPSEMPAAGGGPLPSVCPARTGEEPPGRCPVDHLLQRKLSGASGGGPVNFVQSSCRAGVTVPPEPPPSGYDSDPARYMYCRPYPGTCSPLPPYPPPPYSAAPPYPSYPAAMAYPPPYSAPYGYLTYPADKYPPPPPPVGAERGYYSEGGVHQDGRQMQEQVVMRQGGGRQPEKRRSLTQEYLAAQAAAEASRSV
ncbi:hypothetical protein FJT64_003259 [Amphibalanus amphitrite]|uniref:Uncharacterized protein n=1 Tax=Amphibalanus amphitrite TaxID=1232801 RepID=A0A6A4WFE8_AMPAM|nr:hypothetical protein FJT64_003259 [Amphibalanus amphitrite]